MRPKLQPSVPAAAIALLLVAAPLLAQAATGELGLTRVTDNISLITGAGANVVVLQTDDGLALVDSGAPEQADALLGFIDEAFDGAPIRVLFNTHWRPDHTGANEAIANRGATIIAHENTRLWMGTEYYVEWEQKNFLPRPDAALPTQTFYSSDPQPLTFELDGYVIEYGHLAEANTDGDIYVRFVDDDVIAVGDVLAVDAFPTLDYSTGGWIGGSQEAMSLLLEIAGSATQIIAGDGPPQSRDALQSQQDMLDELRARIRLQMIAGKGIDEILEADVLQGYEHLSDPARFIGNVYNGLWWGGRLRGPI